MADKKRQEDLIEMMLGNAVRRSVSEKLGSVARELGELTKEMSPEDSGRAKLMLLEMMKKATEQFFNKMGERIDKKDLSE
jgi:hypothetical protein